MTVSVSHVGICVSDLERSVRFYRDALGFEPASTHHVGGEFATLMEVDGVDLHSQMLVRDGVTIELLGFASPGVVGDGQRRPMNQLGFTHISLLVDDVDQVASTIEEMGGTAVRSSRTTFDGPGVRLDFLYCTDPDGVRIELMDLPAASVPGQSSGTVMQ